MLTFDICDELIFLDNWRAGIHFFVSTKKHILTHLWWFFTHEKIVSYTFFGNGCSMKTKCQIWGTINRLLCKFCSKAQKSLKIPKKSFALNRGLLKFFQLWQLLQTVVSSDCWFKLSLALYPHGDWFLKVLISFMPSQSIALQWIW